MKIIFFLLLILPFGINFAYAEKELNYDDVILSTNTDGTTVHKWSTAPERILSDGEYVDFRFIDGADFLSVETGHGSIKLNKNTCSFDFYKKRLIDGVPLFTDSIVAKIANSGTENWNGITQINNAVCEASGDHTQLVAKKLVPGVGLMEYKYINTGSTWKTQLEATNLSANINKKFGFTQTINLNRDTIQYGGSVKNLDNYADTTFSRTWLENNNGKIINFFNDINFDFDLGFENLDSIAVYNTGENKSKLSFNYLRNAQVILPNDTLIIDPTYSSNNPVNDGFVEDSSGNNVCDVGSITDAASGNNRIIVWETVAAEDCDRGYYDYDTSSIPDGSIITNTVFKFEQTYAASAINCDYVSMGTTRASDTAANIFTAISGGTVFVNNDATCTTTGTNKSVDLGATADAEVQAKLTSDFFTFGVKADDETISATGHYMYIASEETGGATPKPTLEITYSTTRSPYAVTDLISTSTLTTSVALDWTAPYAGGGNQAIIGYQINRTTPWGTPTVLVNDTGTTVSAYTSTGLSLATQYSFRVSAWTNNTGGHPFSNATGNILNVTTLAGAPPNPVTVLTASSITANTLRLDWSAPTSFGLGPFQTYLVNVTSPWGAPLTFKINSTALNANITGLTMGTDYSFRVSAVTPVPYNTTGSDIENITTPSGSYGRAPTSLTVNDCYHTCTTQLNLEWVASTIQNILGYKIERQVNSGSWTCGFQVLACNTTSTAVFYNNTGLSTSNIYNYRVTAMNATGFSSVSNTYEMTTHKLPNAINSLTATADEFTDVELSWTAPHHHSPGIITYQINYTTPYGLPQTIWSHPASTTIPISVTGLTIGNDYSFRVTAVTIHGMNSSGAMIANSTTSTVFELGNLPDPDTTNFDDYKIFFTRTDTNATSILLEVTYPASYTLSCNIFQKLAATNQTYTGLTETPVVDGDTPANVVSSFRFNGPNDEIIHVICTDILTGDEAYYIITVTDFELLDQIANFRNGTYGTTGKIGGLDLITLFIIIISMIGFNRVNPIAGVAFTCITVGIAAWYGIIAFYQIMYPALAMVVLLAYTRTRQQD